MHFTFQTFPPYSSKIVSVRATLMMDSAPSSFLKPGINRTTTEKYITNEKQLLQLASRLKSNNPDTTPANIYQWIADNITYTGFSSAAKGARRAFFKREGDCTEFADLFVTLTQAAGVPARKVSGYLASSSGTLKAVNCHDWAEFYDNGVWRIADAQQRNFDKNYTSYVAMRIHDPSYKRKPENEFYRFSVEGKGLTAKMDS